MNVPIYNKQATPPSFLFLQRIHARAGPHQLLEAVEGLRKNLGPVAQLVRAHD